MYDIPKGLMWCGCGEAGVLNMVGRGTRDENGRVTGTSKSDFVYHATEFEFSHSFKNHI